MPERIQLRRTKGWRKPEGAVSVVRGTDYGNAFRIGDRLVYERDMPDGTVWTRHFEVTRDLAIALFRAALDACPDWKAQAAAELRGKDLACWCALDQACHADVLLDIANAGDTDARS